MRLLVGPDADQAQQRPREQVDEPGAGLEQPQRAEQVASSSATRSGWVAPITFGVISEKTMMMKETTTVLTA